MGNFDRLMPTALADCDPSMFFSFVLHSKSVVEELKLRLCSDELVKEWETVCAAYIKSVIAIKEICPSQSEAARILPNPDGNWNLLNDQIHYNIAYRNAKLILALGMQWTLESATAPPRIELFDHYIGTDIDQKLTELRQALNSRDQNDIDLVLQDIFSWSETKTCDFCGVQNKKMYDCTGCYSAGYCSTQCQRSAWTAGHKKVCKALRKERDARKGQQKKVEEQPRMKTAAYSRKAVKKQAQSPMSVYNETSSLGSLRLLYVRSSMFGNGMPTNMASFKSIDYKDTIFKYEFEANSALANASATELASLMLSQSNEVKMFCDDLSNVDPVMRVCLACVPVPNLDIVKRSIDDALSMAGSIEHLKMPWVGFTPLEFASKKGHLDVVKWLLADPRTKAMVNVGAPLGWACYTNQISVARLLVKHGAAVDSTTDIFWNGRPPMLAAAENGSLETVKYLVEECGVPISLKWKGYNIRDHVFASPGWDDMPGHQKVLEYARRKGVR